MNKRKIDKPKVFISYAWGTKEYQNKVISFAHQLMGDGVDVIIDKWDLSEGNDTFAFMEKCVTDSTITNVLILLDPVYATKADAHSGGVGTETQIISAKVYKEVTQDKFIPIVFERDEKGQVCKPTYLQGRLHFDLSVEEKYDEEYIRLVKMLYGEEVYPKPELGIKPAWVGKTETIEIRKRTTYDSLKTIQPDKARKIMFSNYLDASLGKLMKMIDDEEMVGSIGEVISFYEKFRPVRTEFLTLLEYSIFVTGSENIIISKLEGVAVETINNTSITSALAQNFLHELFIYTIAFYIKNEDYDSAGSILGRTYYNPQKYNENVSGYNLFYSGRFDYLDRAMDARDKKKYISGIATYWIENIDVAHITKEQFLLADLICYNYSVYGKDYLNDRYWFPLTYLYDDEYSGVLGVIGKKLVSREFATRILPLFGYESIEDFRKRLESVEEDINKGEYREYRYHEVWHPAPLLNQYIDLKKFASVR